MTKANAQKLVDYMPEKAPVKELIQLFRNLERMEELQFETGEGIDWESLKEEMGSWGINQ